MKKRSLLLTGLSVVSAFLACQSLAPADVDVDKPPLSDQTETPPAQTQAALTRRSDGAELLYDPTPPSSAQNAAFSPDGRRLLFTRFDNGYNWGPAGLYTLNLYTFEIETLLYESEYDSVNLPGAAWNPVMGLIVFSSEREGDLGEIWTHNPDSGSFMRITHHQDMGEYYYFLEPSFSPDGQWIVFEVSPDETEDVQQGSIWKVRMDGSEMTQLTGGPSENTDDRQPNWSPRGDRILFQRREPGSDDWDIYTMAPDGSDFRQVTDSPSSDTDASWSPNGRWIVYSSDFGELPSASIFVIPAVGGEPARVTFEDEYEDAAPSWSPDGIWIAFESFISAEEENPSSLWRIVAPFLNEEHGY